ncbi:MAG: hypothetical protein CO140_03595 [Candidatus Moranbacteria bacterium CG_4_9_14_3_um_filter_40_7]|nr:MAG: hypothetical protein CO140_03595 [Candidatus Moranbacteria bacterium CG_4_9_14_3_um_filter_40_7]
MFTKKNAYIILAVIIIFGAFLRFYKLGDNAFVADEFLDINSTYAYFKTGVWQNWDFNFGQVNSENVFAARDERAWIYKWQVAKIFQFLPPTEGVARSVSALWSVLTIFLIYLTGSYFTKNKTIGLLGAGLFALSVQGIEMGRRLRMYAMFLPVYLLFSWLIFRFLEEKYEGKNGFLRRFSEKWDINPVYLIPAFLGGILSLMTHQLTANIVFVIGFYLLWGAIRIYKKEKIYRNKYFIILSLAVLGIILAGIIAPKEIVSFSRELQFFNNHWEYIGIALSDYSNGILAIMLLVLGAYFICRKQELSQEGNFLVISFLVPLLAAIFLWSRNVGAQYIFFIKPFVIILIAAGIYYLAKFLKDNLGEYGKKAYLLTIIILLLILPNYAYFFQSVNTYNQTSQSDNPNYRKIFTYFKKAKNEGDVLITRNFRNYYWSGTKVKVFDFGGELAKEKLSIADIQKITAENKSGWFIFSDNDESYIANEVITYAQKNWEKISNVQVRGKITVYHWGSSI